MKIVPTNKLGLLAVFSIMSFLIFMAVFIIFILMGERGGQSFFSNLKLTIPFLMATISGIISFLTSIYALKKEISVLVLISLIISIFPMLWTLAHLV